MEDKEYTMEDVKKLIQNDIDNGDKQMPWTLILLTFLYGSMGDRITKDEHIKMKEDIAELKGKMSMLEKFMQ